MLLVVTMIRIDQVPKFPDLVLEVDSTDLRIMELCVWVKARAVSDQPRTPRTLESPTLQLLTKIPKRIFEPVCKARHLCYRRRKTFRI